MNWSNLLDEVRGLRATQRRDSEIPVSQKFRMATLGCDRLILISGHTCVVLVRTGVELFDSDKTSDYRIAFREGSRAHGGTARTPISVWYTEDSWLSSNEDALENIQRIFAEIKERAELQAERRAAAIERNKAGGGQRPKKPQHKPPHNNNHKSGGSNVPRFKAATLGDAGANALAVLKNSLNHEKRRELTESADKK